MSEAQPTPERLVLDNETWGHRDLAEVIASRYFILGDDEMGAASWRAKGLNGNDEGDCLSVLNEHLAPLGMIGVLDLGNPPVLSISELPSGVPVLPKWQQFAVWFTMFSFMTMAGIGLISRNSPGTIFGISVISQAALTFSLPLIGAVALSSEVRKLVAKRHGVRLRGLFPLGFPLADAVWPFGVAGLLPQNRPDQVPYPNRRALAHIEISAPLVTFFCGVFLSIIGLSLTSSSSPGLNSSPLVISANPLLEVISNSWLGDDMDARLQWLHPTGVAGLGLCVVSWIMLMPIPGFPGDHLMHAILGPDRVLAEGNQTYIFALTLVTMVLVFSSETWVPWLFLAALATWRRFSPNPVLDPFVVDEHSGLDDLSRNRTIAAVMVILVAGFPGINGAYHLQDWDEGLSTESWPAYASFEDGHAEIDLLLEPTGVLPVSGWLQMRIEGSPGNSYLIDSDCFGHSLNQTLYPHGGFVMPDRSTNSVCRFDDISHSSPGSVSIDMDINGDWKLWGTFSLVILVDVENHVTQHTIVFQPTDVTSTVDPMWVMVEDTETPRVCTELSVVEGDYVNLSLNMHWFGNYWLSSVNSLAPNPFWYFENETSLGPGTHVLCMRGHEGALSRSHMSFMLGPEIIMSRSNSSNSFIGMPIEGESPTMQVSGGEWKLPDSTALLALSNEPFTLSYVESGPLFCPSTDVIPEINATGDWVRELADRSSILIDPTSDNAGNGTIRIGDHGWLLICNGIHIVRQWEVVEGPEVLFNGLPTGTYTQYSPWIDIGNRENYSMPLSMELSGDADIWSSIPSSNFSVVGPMETLQIEAPTTSGCCMEHWVTVDEDGITIHFAARSDGAVA